MRRWRTTEHESGEGKVSRLISARAPPLFIAADLPELVVGGQMPSGRGSYAEGPPACLPPSWDVPVEKFRPYDSSSRRASACPRLLAGFRERFRSTGRFCRSYSVEQADDHANEFLRTVGGNTHIPVPETTG